MSPHSDEEASSTPEHGASDTPAADHGFHTAADAIPHSAPTLEEITKLTRHELSTAQDDDSITQCGRAALALLRANPDLTIKFAYQKLHDVPYKEVKSCWRRLYTDATLWRVLAMAEAHHEKRRSDRAWLDEVVKSLDMALILTAGPGREELVELWFAALEAELAADEPARATTESLERPAKKVKLENTSSIPLVFPTALVEPSHTLRHPISRCDNLSLSAFQKKLSSPATHTPLIIANAIQHWPALSDRSWNSPTYLLKRTLGGRRLVPIETGRSYTDTGWGQKITTFSSFMDTYMLNKPTLGDRDTDTGYLAQHDLFTQIPSLRADICIPDYCYASPSPYLPPNIDPAPPTLEDPQLNAWFGPRGTISPLHTDPYHNILAQVVGYKYVRCYSPHMTEKLWPRGTEEGVDMRNTSTVDLDEAMEIYPHIGIEGLDFPEARTEEIEQRRKEFEEKFPGFKEAEYVEGVLGPGECLYLPPGWWHYVRSLSPSFSVSFWFN